MVHCTQFSRLMLTMFLYLNLQMTINDEDQHNNIIVCQWFKYQCQFFKPSCSCCINAAEISKNHQGPCASHSLQPHAALTVSGVLHAHMADSCVPEFHCVAKSCGATAQTIQPHPLLVEICLGWLKGLEHNAS